MRDSFSVLKKKSNKVYERRKSENVSDYKMSFI